MVNKKKLKIDIPNPPELKEALFNNISKVNGTEEKKEDLCDKD
jgi:hypothetical protein